MTMQRSDALAEWPFRDKDAPIPLYCPKCGRHTVVRKWETIDHEAAYVYVACDGGKPAWLVWLTSRLAATEYGHWTMTIDRVDLSTLPDYDPLTGVRYER